VNGINSVLIVGRLGADPEVRNSQSGKTITKFRVATDRYNGPDREKTTDWHSIVVFGRSADNCARYLGKGSIVGVQGSIKYNSFTKQDGSLGYSTDIIADRVDFIGPPSSSKGNSGGQGADYDDEFSKPQQVGDDEMPF
jgi:single-strand DNA-binding protein